MTATNRRVLAAFFALLGLTVAAAIVWDVHLFALTGDGADTISWSMALLGAESPGAVFAFAYLVGGITWGLAAHFWFGQPSPKLWADYREALAYGKRLDAENEALNEQITTLNNRLAVAQVQARGDKRYQGDLLAKGM